MNRASLVLVASLVLAACVPAPKKAYTPAEAQGLSDLDELMHVNAHTMDPLFSIEDQAAFSDAEFAQLGDAGRMAEATSAAVKANVAGAYPAGFAAYADTMNAEAKKLAAAAGAKDAAGAGAAVRAIHAACKGCHGEFR